jgi:Zn-dependent protease
VPDPIESLVFYVAFLFSATLHEASHAWAAKRGGDLTAYRGGQVSLDPLPHIRREPFGMVVLPLVTVFVSGWPFGFASAPYDPDWARRHPRRSAWMALAGPGANLALVLAAALSIRAGMLAGVFYAPDSVRFAEIAASDSSSLASAAAFVLGTFFSLNLVLFALNLLPIPPLDGSGAVPLLLGPETARRYLDFVNQPMLGWIGILVAWQVFDAIFDPLFLAAVNLLYPEIGYS